MAFFIDAKGQSDSLLDRASDDESDDDFQFIPMPQASKSATVTSRSCVRSKDGDIDLDDTYLDFGETSSQRLRSKKGRRKATSSNQAEPKTTSNAAARCLTKSNEILEKSVLQPGLEKLHSLPSYDEGRRQMVKKRQEERGKSAGKNWNNMKAPEITEEMKNDLEVLQMRSALDPKHFYKKNNFKNLPKYFQVGRVIEPAADFYHSRIPKKERKKTLVDELLADSEFQKATKKRFTEIITEQKKTHFKAHRQAKRLKKKK